MPGYISHWSNYMTGQFPLLLVKKPDVKVRVVCDLFDLRGRFWYINIQSMYLLLFQSEPNLAKTLRRSGHSWFINFNISCWTTSSGFSCCAQWPAPLIRTKSSCFIYLHIFLRIVSTSPGYWNIPSLRFTDKLFWDPDLLSNEDFEIIRPSKRFCRA